jgi:hypothetical protein
MGGAGSIKESARIDVPTDDDVCEFADHPGLPEQWGFMA